MDWIASLGMAGVWRSLSVLALGWLALFFVRTLLSNNWDNTRAGF